MRSRRVTGSSALLLWLPPLAWAAVLFALSSGSGPAFAPPFPNIDKLEHAGAYSLLGFLVARACGGTWPLSAMATVLAGGFAAAFYGVSDEIHQSFTPGRMVEAADALADAFGGFAGAFSFVLVSKWRGQAEAGHG
jgi:VanZ family protein